MEQLDGFEYPYPEDEEVQAGPSVPYAQRQAWTIGELGVQKLKCCACTEKFGWDSVTTLECGDRYCTPCLRRVIMRAVTERDLAYLPPRCHGNAIPDAVIIRTLTPKISQNFETPN